MRSGSSVYYIGSYARCSKRSLIVLSTAHGCGFVVFKTFDAGQLYAHRSGPSKPLRRDRGRSARSCAGTDQATALPTACDHEPSEHFKSNRSCYAHRWQDISQLVACCLQRLSAIPYVPPAAVDISVAIGGRDEVEALAPIHGQKKQLTYARFAGEQAMNHYTLCYMATDSAGPGSCGGCHQCMHLSAQAAQRVQCQTLDDAGLETPNRSARTSAA